MLMHRSIAGMLLLLGGAVQAGELPLAACNTVRYSPEATRYQMQGTTVLNLTMNPAGKPIKATIASSSGWKTLDADALRLARSCRFGDGAEPGTLSVAWRLPEANTVPAQPLPGTCQPSLAYRVTDPGAATIKVRLLVWTDGQVYAPRIETGSDDDAFDHWALAYAHSCRYTPAMRAGAPVTGSALLHLAVDAGAVSEAAMQALYERSLPALRASMAGRVEYGIRYKYLKNYDQAKAELARLKAGGDYPIPPTAPDEPPIVQPLPAGQGWLLPPFLADDDMTRALRAASVPSLLPAVYLRKGHYVIVHLDAVRPAGPPGFETMRPALRAALLAGTGIGTVPVIPPGDPD
jgi:TonB family protein